ncbi:MAG: polysaccharide deacetylase family protein [Clostridia bacterium]|nr:polysaccharide deacetylase family protein [Clostridia bacterium]
MKNLKGLTFSYDDGVTQDIRLAELFHKYGMKATFNLNSGLLGLDGSLNREGKTVSHVKVNPADVKRIYAGHEVAGHALTHPCLPRQTDDEIVRQVEEDRLKLSELCGYEVLGFAHPFGNYDSRVTELIKGKTGIKYCRTVKSTHAFDIQQDLYEFHPTVYHHREWDEMFELGEKFLNLKTEQPAIFYVWGHAYEFDIHNTWDRFEEFLKMMSGKSDITYGTNSELLLGWRGE